MSEPFRVVTPHREGCEGGWRFTFIDHDPTEVRCYCAESGHCHALAYMPESAIAALAENAELRAERDEAAARGLAKLREDEDRRDPADPRFVEALTSVGLLRDVYPGELAQRAHTTPCSDDKPCAAHLLLGRYAELCEHLQENRPSVRLALEGKLERAEAERDRLAALATELAHWLNEEASESSGPFLLDGTILILRRPDVRALLDTDTAGGQ